MSAYSDNIWVANGCGEFVGLVKHGEDNWTKSLFSGCDERICGDNDENNFFNWRMVF